MSWQPCADPVPGDNFTCDAIEAVIIPRAHDLGGFEVRRALPSPRRRMVGPFIFFDQMGPSEFLLGGGVDVRPHPHIGLSTVTYLFDGEIMHRDSLGTEIAIRPGELNWMTAGRGIVHSERTPEQLRKVGSKMFGIQSWVALSAEDEETAPDFVHYDAGQMPVLSEDGKTVRVIAGAILGARSSVNTSSPMFYADVALGAGASLPLDPDYEERAIYTVSGEIEIAGDVFGPAQLLVFRPGDRITVRAHTEARFMMLGGEPWMDRGSSGGTSCHRGRTASSRQRRIGKPPGSIRCRATASSSRCLNLRPSPSTTHSASPEGGADGAAAYVRYRSSSLQTATLVKPPYFCSIPGFRAGRR